MKFSRSARLLALASVIFVLLLFPAVRASAAFPTPSLGDVDKIIQQIVEVQLERITLVYLSDQRSKDLLSTLLKSFPKNLKKNFRANITGAYRKVLLGNFDAKLFELNLDVTKLVGQSPELTELLLQTAEATPFPLDLAFSSGLKKLGEMASFQMAQRASDAGNPAAANLCTRIQNRLKTLESEGSKDQYEVVKAIYASKKLSEIPIWWYDDAQYDVGYVTHGENPPAPTQKGRKNWTVLIFLNADNDLETSGMKDLNEMECIGSDENMNIVVQIDRQKGSRGDTVEDGNWIGTRRYEVTKDRTKKIASKLVMNLDERDMGNRKELAEFLQWGVETYPADHFVAVVWNHGAGWKGISLDDQSGKMLNIPDVLWAFQQAVPSLQKVNPKHPRFDILDFDACLMGMIEIAYELRNVTDFLLASEQTEPGQGMPYQGTLRPIKEDPSVTPRQLAKLMTSAYVKSYAAGGSQTTRRFGGAPVTKSAYDLSRISPLVELVNKLGASLSANHSAYTRLLVDEFGQFAKVRRYSDESFVDLVDFSMKLAQLADLPEETRGICKEILTLIGYPKLDDRLSQPVVIKRRTPGAVVWGYNGWKTPPKEMRPSSTEIYHSRFARTPLAGPDDKGDYSCVIGPFTVVLDPVAKRREYVKEINFKIQYQDGKTSPDMTERRGREYTLVTQFPPTSPLIAEGHTQGMGNSFGMSIYYPYCLEFQSSYKMLQFAKETSWASFISRVPQYQAGSKLLVTGGLVEDIPSLRPLLKVFKQLGVRPDILWDPKVFGYRFPEILAGYKDGLVITDSVSVNSFGRTAPSSDDLIGYLEAGGRLFIAAQSIEQQNSNTRLLEEFFKFKYVEDDRELPRLTFADKEGKIREFGLNGEDSVPSANDVTVMECAAPAEPFVKTADGRGAGISVTGANYRGVYLGFRFEAIDGEENRSKLIEKVFDFLVPGLIPHAASTSTSTPTPESR